MSDGPFLDLVDPEVAREAVAAFDLDPDPERVPLEDAAGRVLADRVDATMDVPGFDRASMDGYAVRAADTVGAGETDPAVLSVAGSVHAGEQPRVRVEDGVAVEISTGAVMPPGADAVVMVEKTEVRGEDVAVRTAVTPGRNVMPAGDDIAAGERALGPGTVLTAREVGLLSALGRETVPVVGRPRVGVVSTGEELVQAGEPLHPERGEIYDVNGRTVATAVRDAGGEPDVAPTVPDDRETIADRLTGAAERCDLVLTSGSTSAGAVDVLGEVVDEYGEVTHHGIAIKPGKPTLIGRVGGTPYVGLPGYPVSALSIFRTFVAPALRSAAGRPELAVPTTEATMGIRVRHDEGRARLLPVGLVEDGDGETLAYPVDKGSGATTSLTRADGVVEIAAETQLVESGSAVTVDLFGTDVRPPRLLGVGEDDPTLWDLLDAVDRTRYLPVGAAEGERRLAGGVPDVAVVTGEARERSERASDGERGERGAQRLEASGTAASGTTREPDSGVRLGGWTREWGLAVRPDAGVDSLAALVDEDVSFVNRAGGGLRTALDDALSELAAECDVDRSDLTDDIAGYDQLTRGHEAPARRVAAEQADAGPGLRSTAAALDLEFVPLGRQPVHVVAADARVEKEGVRDLEAALEAAPERLDDRPGVEWD